MHIHIPYIHTRAREMHCSNPSTYTCIQLLPPHSCGLKASDVHLWESMADHDIVADALTSGRVPAALSFLTGRWQRDALKRGRENQTSTQAPLQISDTNVESKSKNEHKHSDQDVYKLAKPSQRRWFIAAVERDNLVHGYAQRFRALGQFLVYELLCKDKSDSLHLCEALLQAMGVHATLFFRSVF